MHLNNHLLNRSLLTLSDFTPAEVRLLLDLARAVKADHRARRVHQRFRGLSLAMLYEKPSTRTRCAFETAFGEEGGHPVFLSAQEIHLGVKESLEDTARVLGRMFHAIQFRGFHQETVGLLARYAGIPVYNGLTDTRHPTQALADLMTLEERYGRLRGLSLAYVGDCRNNIASSLMIGCALMGVNFAAVGPRELAPEAGLLAECRELAAAAGSSVVAGDRAGAGGRGRCTLHRRVGVDGRGGAECAAAGVAHPLSGRPRAAAADGQRRLRVHARPAGG